MAVKKELEALSKKIDKIVAGIGKSSKAKLKVTAKKITKHAEPKNVVVPKKSTIQTETEAVIVISGTENGIEEESFAKETEINK